MMDDKQLQKAWEEISFEIINVPRIKTPYPSEIVLMRELLLFAQIILEKVEENKGPVFYERLYKKIMYQYYKQKKWLKI